MGWDLYENLYEPPVLSLSREWLPKSFEDMRTALFEDSKGRVWFPSAWGLGLAIVKPNLFQSYFSFSEEEEKPFSNSCRGIIAEGDTLLVNCEFGGLVSIPKEQPDNWMLLNDHSRSELYYGRPLIRGSRGGFYTGEVSPPVEYFSTSSKQKSSFTFRKGEGEFIRTSWSFYEDNEGGLWVGMSGELGYKSPKLDYL